MDHSEILKQVRKIELKMRGLAQHVFAGQYQSAFKGRGMSFSEVRAYQYGDDVRSIDWNVTARFRSPHIKVFEEERELSVFLVIDVSGSMYFGMSNQSKISLAVLLVATLGFSAVTNGDKVGVVLVSDEVEDYIPPKKGADHVHFIIRRILNLNPKSKKTDFSAGIKLLLNLHKQKSICFVLSDFPNPSGMKDDLLKLKKKHDVIGIQLSDEGERTLPKVGFVRWYNAETQSTSWIDTSSGVARKEIESKKQKRDLEIQQLFHSIQLDFLALDTSQDPYNQLVTLFRHRK